MSAPDHPGKVLFTSVVFGLRPKSQYVKIANKKKIKKKYAAKT